MVPSGGPEHQAEGAKGVGTKVLEETAGQPASVYGVNGRKTFKKKKQHKGKCCHERQQNESTTGCSGAKRKEQVADHCTSATCF